MNIPSTKTEHRAVNALEAIIDEHSTMEHQINGNDKEMSWDGYIWLYKDNNGDQSKSNFDARVPVQIKGHHDPEHKYIGKDRISYSVELADLEAYATEKGVLYFQIFVDGKGSEIFYVSLYPSKIADYLDAAKAKGNTTNYSIPFIRLEKNTEKLYVIVKQFSDEAKKQGSAYTPLVQDRIRSIDFDKLTSINLSVVGARDSYNALLRLSSGDVCLYGKTDGDNYFRPLEWHDSSKFFAGREVEQTVSVDDEVFYTRYNCIADSDGGMTLKLSPNLELKLTEGTFSFKVISTIKELGHDAKFLLRLKKANAFTIQGYEIKFSDPKVTPDFEERLEYIADLYDTLEMIGFDLNTKISQYTEEQQSQFVKLVNLRLGAYNSQLKEDISRYNWKFGEKYYPLLICKKDGRTELTSSLYTKSFVVFIPCKDSADERGYKMPLFIYNDVDVLSNLYACDYDAFYQQIDDSDINELTADAFIECSLILINVYDRNSDTHFLDLAAYLLHKLKPYVQKDLLLLNMMQIKKRRTGLNSKDIEQIKSIDSDEIHIMFGKNVLLGNKQHAKQYFDSFSKENKERYVQFPIYELYRHM